jgi:small-conductance mechanosensitive channel
MQGEVRDGHQLLRGALLIGAGALAALLWAPPVVVAADAPARQADEAAPAVAIPSAAIPARAEQATRELYDIRATLTDRSAVEAVESGLPGLRDNIDRLVSDAVVDQAIDVSARDVEDLGRKWRRIQERLSDWDRVVARRTQTVEAATARTRAMEEAWRVTAAQAAADRLPQSVLDEIGSVRTAAEGTLALAQKERDFVLGLASQVASSRVRTTAGLAQVDAAADRLRRQLATIDAPPLWTALANEGLEKTNVVWRRPARDLAEFVEEARGRLIAYGLVLLLLLALALRTRSQVAQRPADARDSASLRRVVERPFAAAVLLTAVLALVPGRNDPVVLGELAALLILLPLHLFLSDLVQGRLASLVPVLGPVVLVSVLRQMMPTLSVGARLILLGEIVVLGAWVLGTLRRIRPTDAVVGDWGHRLRRVAHALLVVLAGALVADVVGNVSLAALLTRGVLGSLFLGLGLWAGCLAAEGFFDAVIYSGPVQRVHAIARRTPYLRRRAPGVLRAVARLVWLGATLQLFGLLRPALDALQDLLGWRLEVGSLSLSLGDILAFGLTVWVSVAIARILRTLLEDDVLPRFALPRGVPNAISAGASYFVLFLGLLFALSAAGLDLSRVTILAGAFGVGIGFGLQNVVNNFVSGLILLFERPLRIGDVVELGTVSGSVRRIGIRSSSIVTFDGAEVIVPNATLIAERVSNWSFADRRRIDVGLALPVGTDPERVLGILRDVAAAHADVQREPPPEALLVSLGPGRLDFVLRVWTRYSLALSVRSDLAVASFAALRAAGIELPTGPVDLMRPAGTGSGS